VVLGFLSISPFLFLIQAKGLILLSFVLLVMELANVLLGALGNTRKGGPSELEEPEEASSLHRKEAKKL
jgi:hypothetical protein